MSEHLAFAPPGVDNPPAPASQRKSNAASPTVPSTSASPSAGPGQESSFISFLGAAANMAATKIQAAFRGYQVRQDLQDEKKERKEMYAAPARVLTPPEQWQVYLKQWADDRKIERPAVGTMHLVVVSADKLHNAQCCTAQDPYVRFLVNKDIYRTEKCKSGGQSPSWTGKNDFSILVNKGKEDRIVAEVMNQNLFSDDLLGRFEVNVDDAAKTAFQPEFHRNFDVNTGTGVEGKVLVRGRFIYPVSFNIVEAKDLTDVQLIGKQDPYVIATWKGDLAKNEKAEKRTKIHEDGGRNPKWNETITYALADDVFQLNDEQLNLRKTHEKALPSLQLEIWDDNVVVDKVIGYCVITFEQMIELRVKAVPYWINVYKGTAEKQGKELAGKIQISMPRLA